MIYARVLLAAFVVLAVIYYVMVIGQLFGKWKITNREIKFSLLLDFKERPIWAELFYQL